MTPGRTKARRCVSPLRHFEADVNLLKTVSAPQSCLAVNEPSLLALSACVRVCSPGFYAANQWTFPWSWHLVSLKCKLYDDDDDDDDYDNKRLAAVIILVI